MITLRNSRLEYQGLKRAAQIEHCAIMVMAEIQDFITECS